MFDAYAKMHTMLPLDMSVNSQVEKVLSQRTLYEQEAEASMHLAVKLWDEAGQVRWTTASFLDANLLIYDCISNSLM